MLTCADAGGGCHSLLCRPHVKVLLAAEDPFCPLSQEHVLRKTGAAIHTDLDGGHVFGDGEAQQLIVKLFDQLCEKAGGRAMR